MTLKELLLRHLSARKAGVIKSLECRRGVAFQSWKEMRLNKVTSHIKAWSINLSSYLRWWSVYNWDLPTCSLLINHAATIVFSSVWSFYIWIAGLTVQDSWNRASFCWPRLVVGVLVHVNLNEVIQTCINAIIMNGYRGEMIIWCHIIVKTVIHNRAFDPWLLSLLWR